MAIRWIRNVIIDGEKTTIEIQLGDQKIGDKCYTRIGSDLEQWFDNACFTRNDIVAQGIDILQNRLKEKQVLYPDGRSYDWR